MTAHNNTATPTPDIQYSYAKRKASRVPHRCCSRLLPQDRMGEKQKTNSGKLAIQHFQPGAIVVHEQGSHWPVLRFRSKEWFFFCFFMYIFMYLFNYTLSFFRIVMQIRECPQRIFSCELQRRFKVNTNMSKQTLRLLFKKLMEGLNANGPNWDNRRRASLRPLVKNYVSRLTNG